jgi:hypothetical protein
LSEAPSLASKFKNQDVKSFWFPWLDGEAYLCEYEFMRTTIDLPEELFREAKTRAVQEGITFKDLMTGFIRYGLKGPQVAKSSVPMRRNPPPVAIRRTADHPRVPARSNRELNALLEKEEVSAAQVARQIPQTQA